jgi:hypothetical protein
VLAEDADGWRMWVVSHRAELAELAAANAPATAQLLASFLRADHEAEAPERMKHA